MESLLYKTKCEWPISNAGGADRLTFTRSQVSRMHWAPVFPNGDAWVLCVHMTSCIREREGILSPRSMGNLG